MIKLVDFLLIMQSSENVKIRDNELNVLFTGKSENAYFLVKDNKTFKNTIVYNFYTFDNAIIIEVAEN
jgi:hypothetical protein